MIDTYIGDDIYSTQSYGDFTTIHSGYFTIVPGSESLLVDIICHSLFNVINYAMTKYYKYKISRSHLKILQKLWKKYFCGSNRVWTRDLEVMRPACYQKAMETCCYKEGFFMVVNKTALKLLLFWRFLQYLLPNLDS